MVEEFKDYLMAIENVEYREKLINLFEKIRLKFPMLKTKISWGMPVFITDNSYIIGVSAFKDHFSIAPEPLAIDKFSKQIDCAGYKSTKGLFKIKWTDQIDFELVYRIIEFNIQDKKDCKTFWRK